MKQTTYAWLCVLGVAIPLIPFIPWLIKNGQSVSLLIEQAIATPISSFAWADILVSAATLMVFIHFESKRIGMRRPWLALFGLGIGVSLALPLFLLLREKHLNRE